MKVIVKVFEEQTEPLVIIPLADTHIGDSHCDMELINALKKLEGVVEARKVTGH